MGLCHFQSDWAAAYDDEFFDFFTVVEDVFVGEYFVVLNAGDFRNKGTGACGDYEIVSLYGDYFFILGFDIEFMFGDESCMTLDDFDAESFESIHGIVGFDTANDLVYVCVYV